MKGLKERLNKGKRAEWKDLGRKEKMEERKKGLKEGRTDVR